MKLRKQLNDLEPTLISRLQNLESKAREIGEYAQGGSHLTFTTHGFSHMSAVEENFDWLLSEEDIRSFQPMEIFCLLCATFFHDTSMIPTQLGQEDHARSHHATLAKDFLLKHRDLLGLSIHEAETIGEIVLGHGVKDLQQIRKEIVLGNTIVDIRKLAACLSMADICHADSTRAPEIVYQHLDLDQESRFHWKRHLQIAGITRSGAKLVMSAHYFTDDGLKAVEDYGNEIRRQLKAVRPYFELILCPIANVEIDAHKLRSELDITLRFQANTPAILDILIDGVYQRTDVFLRELVQNALDACHLKQAKAIRRADAYSPRIVISLLVAHGKLKEVRVDDNGIGMDVHDVRDTVLWIGNSIAKRSDIKALLSETTQKDLIATFGIGLLSCFKAAKTVSVRSAKENADPIEFSITSIKNDIKPAPSKDVGVGTTFIVEIKDQVADELMLEDAAAYYFRMVRQAPIELLKLEWGEKAHAYTREELFRIASTQGKQVGVQQFGNRGDKFCTHDIKGDDYVAWLWLPECDELDGISTDEGRITILNEGVFVSADVSSEWLPKHLAVCHGVINFSAKAVDLPVARDKVVNNKKTKDKRNDIAQRSFGLIDLLVNMTSSTSGLEGDLAALTLTRLLESADADNKKILRRLDGYRARDFQRVRELQLIDIARNKPAAIYVAYSQGKWVSKLCVFDGKQLYHKPDDFTDLQSALLKQEGMTVISAAQCAPDGEKIIEFSLLKEYFAGHSIRVVDLTSENQILGKYRSKPIPRWVREELSQKVKFVEIVGLPDKRSWRVGDETWINVSNPEMEQLYCLLQSDTLAADQLRMARLLVEISAYQFEESVTSVLEYLDGSEALESLLEPPEDQRFPEPPSKT